jgi:hypothetical protein
MKTLDEFRHRVERYRANDAWFAAFERVTTLRARTPAGIRAKVAALLVAVLEHVVMGPEYTLEDNGLWREKLAISLCDHGWPREARHDRRGRIHVVGPAAAS